MGTKQKIVKRIFLTATWALVGTGMLVLLVAAAKNQSGKICKDVIVNIKTTGGAQYISKTQILKTISGGKPELVKGQLIKTFDLNQLEDLLETNLWIRNAELFFDKNDNLHVDVTEREPVARIFTVSGASFYLDDAGEELPITNDQIARVPVFTSFPNETSVAREKDSLLKLQIREMGHYILKHDFWMAQIEQVNINHYEFELVPKLGNHIILFGNGNLIEPKFNRIALFYQKIMNKTGWNYYSQLDVRFNKQLIASRRDSISLFKTFEVDRNHIQISATIDSTRSVVDTAAKTERTNINEGTNSLLTSGTGNSSSEQKPVVKPYPVKPVSSQNPNALKNQLLTPETNPQNSKSNEQNPKVHSTGGQVKKPVVTPEEEKILNEAKEYQPTKTEIKKIPKAVMKKQNG